MAFILGNLISCFGCARVSFMLYVWEWLLCGKSKPYGIFRVYVLYVKCFIYCDIVNADVVR